MVQPWTCLWFAEILKANINIIITFKRLTNPIDKISRPFDTDTLRCDHTVESTHVSTPLQRGSAMRQQAWGLISQPCGEPLLLSPRRFHSRSCGVLLLCLVLAVHSGLAVTVTWHALVGSRNLTSTWQEGRDCLCNTHSLRLAPLDPRSPSQPRSYNLLISFWHLSPSLSFTGQVVSWRPVIFLPPPAVMHVFPPTLMPSCDVKSCICVFEGTVQYTSFRFFPPLPRGSDWPFSLLSLHVSPLLPVLCSFHHLAPLPSSPSTLLACNVSSLHFCHIWSSHSQSWLHTHLAAETVTLFDLYRGDSSNVRQTKTVNHQLWADVVVEVAVDHCSEKKKKKKILLRSWLQILCWLFISLFCWLHLIAGILDTKQFVLFDCCIVAQEFILAWCDRAAGTRAQCVLLLTTVNNVTDNWEENSQKRHYKAIWQNHKISYFF